MQSRKPIRLRLRWVIVLLMSVLLINLFFGDAGIRSYYKLSQRQQELQNEVYALQSRIAELRRHIYALNYNQDYIEMLARQYFGYKRRGEDVIQIQKTQNVH